MRTAYLLLAIAPPCLAQSAPNNEDFFPLTVGTKWTYKVSGQDDRFVVTAVRQEMVGSQPCMLMEARLKDKVVATEHLAFTKKGLCRFRADKEDIDPPVCILPSAPQKNNQWSARYKLGMREANARFTIQSPVEQQILGEKRKCVTTSADMSEITGGGNPRPGPRTFVTYAEGVGVVKQVIEEGKGPGRQLTLELDKLEKK